MNFLGARRGAAYHPRMRILGVDPGTLVAGYGCLDLSRVGEGDGAAAVQASDVPIAHRVANLARVPRTRIRVLAAGALRLGRSQDPIERRLHRLADGLRQVIDEWAPDELALEEAFFGKSVQSALRIGEARGVILAECARAGLAVCQYPPARIKRSVTGNGQASKEQVARMVAQSLRLTAEPETQDVTDALAVGLCSVEAKRSPRG